MPASRSRVTIVASYGGIQPSRMRRPARWSGTPSVATMSLTAIGTPASGLQRLAGARRRVDVARRGEGALRVDVQERVDVAVHGGDPVEVGLGHLDGADLLADSASAIDAALSRAMSGSLMHLVREVAEVGGRAAQSSSRIRGTANAAARRPGHRPAPSAAPRLGAPRPGA